MNLLLEGDDLAALLLRAHQEGGATARIVRAQKVRRGGILGFFAKEGFEVAVEIPTEEEQDPAKPSPGLAAAAVASTFPAMPQLTAPAPTAAIEAGSSSLLDLVDRASAAERAATLAITRQTAYEVAIQAIGELNSGSANGDELPAGSSPAERLVAKLVPSRAVTANRQVEETEVAPIEPRQLRLAAANRTDPEKAAGPVVVSAATFTAIEFPHVQFPENRPWPALAGLPGPAAASAGASRQDEIATAIEPSSLNDAALRTDLSEVTDPSVASDQPLPNADTERADTESATDAGLWFHTRAAASSTPVVAVITTAPPSATDSMSQFGQPASNQPESRVPQKKFEPITQLPAQTQTQAEPEAQPEPEPEAQREPEAQPEPETQPESEVRVEPEKQPAPDLEPEPVQPMTESHPSEPNPAPTASSPELSMIGGPPVNGARRLARNRPQRSAIASNLPAGSTARATTVVPKAKPRRGGHRALPVPRLGAGEEPAMERQPVSGDELAPANRPKGLHDDRRPADPPMDPDSVDQLAVPDRPESAVAPGPVETQTTESSWKLLRRWRPGLRKQALEDDVEWIREVDPEPRPDHGRTDSEHSKHRAEPVMLTGPIETPDLPQIPEATQVPEVMQIPAVMQVPEATHAPKIHVVEDFGTWTTDDPPATVVTSFDHDDTAFADDAVMTSFADAATLADVPAGVDVIESFDQLAADRAALRALGVPAAWTENLHAGDRFGSIVTMLGQLAEPRIREDAAVIAVIGPADVVELEAHRTALELPSSGRPRAVTLVPGAVGVDRRAAIARSKRIRPVVISVPIDGYDDPASIRTILSSIKAEAVIVVVDASRPLDEITSWVRALERVDAIALDGALDVESPAAVLGLDVPVIRVDGIAVDRIGWAALLCAQLAAQDASR